MSPPTSIRSTLAEALRGWPPPPLDPAGPMGGVIAVLSWVLLGMALAVMLVVVGVLALALFGGPRWRARLAAERMVWIGGLAFPVVVLTAILIYGLTATRQLSQPPGPGEMRVRVTGEMWWWRVAYVGDDGQPLMVDANEVHIPVGQPVTFELDAADVIHSFWVPRLGGKLDMIPGRRNILRLQADRPGVFAGQCAEYCGGPHALMGFVVVAHPAEDYQRWRTARLQAQAPGPASSPLAARGAQLFGDAGCGACHRIAGTAANGLAGPDLTFVGARRSLGAGILPNNQGALAGWISDSQAIKPGNRMPPFKMLSGEDLRALAAYLARSAMTSETGFDPRLFDRFPTAEPRPEGEFEALQRVWRAPTGWGRLTVVNNNYIGVYYVGAAFLFFLLAGVLALLMRTQLALPMNGVLPQETYNQVFTMHGTVMMFLFAVPAVEALGVMLLPQMLAARDLPFPRLSAYAFWAYLVGGLCFFASIFFGLAPSGGWFMYPPLTSKTFSPGINADFWLLGIGFIEISAIAGAVEIVVGVLKTRAPGMTLDKMPVFAWAMLVFAAMIIIGFPAIILGTLLLELERALGWPFFDPLLGGDPLLWQHLFWFFGHPEVYIIFLPAAGLMSMMLPTIARTPLVGYRLVVLALLATGFISFGVWAHHMFTTGLPTLSVSFFSAASMAVSVPAGVQVFSWIATLAAGRVRWTTPALFAVGSIIIFVMGGLTGVMVAMVPFDWQAHDTYFIVAHLHYVLIGGMVFPLFAAFYYWTPMMSRRALSERLGRWVFGLMFTGMHVAFLPMHLTGLMGMPRRVYTYLPGRGWELPNLISTVGAFLLAAGVLLFVVDLVRNFRFTAEDDAGNVFGAGTLEWLPTGLYSTRSIPRVQGRYPLWDDPHLAADVAAGRYFLPRSATGLRETIITSPLRAEPQYVQSMPGPSAWHVLAAVFTAGFFLLLTIQAYWPGVVSGVLAVVCVLRWMWETDRPMPVETVDIGAGIRVPTYVTGPGGHGWWAMVVLLTVAGMIFLMAGFSYVFLWSRRPELWIDPPAWGWLAAIVAGYAAATLLALAAPRAGRRSGGRLWGPTLMALAAAVAFGAWGLDLQSWTGAGLRPSASSQGATVFALLSWQGLLLAVAVVMAGFLAARAVANLMHPARPTSLDTVSLFLVFIAVQGALGVLLVRLFPGVV